MSSVNFNMCRYLFCLGGGGVCVGGGGWIVPCSDTRAIHQRHKDVVGSLDNRESRSNRLFFAVMVLLL